MRENVKNKGLGRGLAALMGDLVVDTGNNAADLPKLPEDRLYLLGIDQLKPNRFNPRKIFNPEELTELADSIRQKGVLQPLLARKLKGNKDVYEIIAGERRWRAAQQAGLHELKTVVIEASDQEMIELALVENIQRANLNPIEEAAGYQRLLEEFKYTQDHLAKIVGKSRSHIANTIRLLALPEAIKEMLDRQEISAGHARALLTVPEPTRLAAKIVAENLSVRDVERLANESKNKVTTTTRTRTKGKQGTGSSDSDTLALQKKLNEVLGVNVKLNHNRNGSGEIVISYDDIDQCHLIYNKLIA